MGAHTNVFACLRSTHALRKEARSSYGNTWLRSARERSVACREVCEGTNEWFTLQQRLQCPPHRR